LNQFYRNTKRQFKEYLNCFLFFSNTIIESYVLNCFNFSFFDLGFKYLIKIKKLLSVFIIVKIVTLETLFHETKVKYFNYKNIFIKRKIWSILKKAFENKNFLICRILNTIKNGFSIGFCGIVGYLPKKHCLSKNLFSSVFIITSLNIFKKTFILSQIQLNRLCSRILYKLRSKMNYIQKI
jgi:hypothetical protein